MLFASFVIHRLDLSNKWCNLANNLSSSSGDVLGSLVADREYRPKSIGLIPFESVALLALNSRERGRGAWFTKKHVGPTIEKQVSRVDRWARWVAQSADAPICHEKVVRFIHYNVHCILLYRDSLYILYATCVVGVSRNINVREEAS